MNSTSVQYQTREGDRLDEICERYYGNLVGTVEKVLNANPGLASRQAHLPSGLLITLPNLEVEANEPLQLALWS